MGILDKVKEKMAHKNPDPATQNQDQAGQGAGQTTGGQYVDQSGQGMQTAQNVVGQQGGPQDDPNQGGYQDPNQPGYQDPAQSGGFQDQDQGYQDPSQDQGYQGQ